MQQLFDFTPSIFFAFGPPQKSSLIAQYCRENNYVHLKDPIPQTISQLQPKDTIIEGSFEVFQAVQKKDKDMQIIFIGQPQNQRQWQIRRQYTSIGKCRRVNDLNYKSFRKALYPNLIFFYGPVAQQITAASRTLAQNINYACITLPKSANNFISSYKKTCNYVIQGLFTDQRQLSILEQYFYMKIVHLQYNRIDVPNQSEFFDKQFEILPFLKSKPYYIKVNGSAPPIQVMDQVGVGLCPQLIFVNRANEEHDKYIKEFIKETDGLMIGIFDVQYIRKRKNLPLAQNNFAKGLRYTEILFSDLNRKQAVLLDYPWNLSNQIIPFENLNRKISIFVDLCNSKDHQFCDQITSPIYFLEQQKRIVPNQSQKLKDQLAPKVQYWIVNGPTGSGRSTVAKYIAGEFGYKLIQFEPYIASIKQKLLGPDDGQDLPLKKILPHFAGLLRQDLNCVYIFDGFPYEGNSLKQWVSTVGCPNIVNLRVEDLQVIKRTRKKAESDVNAEVTQQDTAKIKQAQAKNADWIKKLNQISPGSKIFQVDYNQPQILAEQSINTLLRPRVYLVQAHNSVIFQNIALRYDMAFINLFVTPLKECLPLVKKANKRDVILCYYSQQGERMVSQDMYWIEKNIGPIRYLSIFNNQAKEAHQNKIKLQKPVVQEKKPAQQQVQGQPPAQQPPKEEGEEGAKKRGLNIYDYEWTNPQNHKNLSQWFWKLKKSITQKKSNPINCYSKFGQTLAKINENGKNCVYEVIQ